MLSESSSYEDQLLYTEMGAWSAGGGGPVEHSGLGLYARQLKGLAHKQDAIEQAKTVDTAAVDTAATSAVWFALSFPPRPFPRMGTHGPAQ